MSRQRRQLSQSGLYHIIFRGISRQNIFEEERDYIKLGEIIAKVKEETNFELYAFCFMTNHVHLFIRERNMGDISKIMTKILSHYATWFNIKYKRSGTLFCNRYKSEPVEDEMYYLGLIRYIHQNPVKAGIVSKVSEYRHSSYIEYIRDDGQITDIDFTLDIINENDRADAINQFAELHNFEEKENFEINESRKKSREAVRRIIKSEISGAEPQTIKTYEKEKRNDLVRKLVFEKGISKVALERETGISRGTIVRICNKM